MAVTNGVLTQILELSRRLSASSRMHYTAVIQAVIRIEETPEMMNIPEPLKTEHDELHRELIRATQAGGRTGEAAKAVAKLLHPHFKKEESDALPLLGFLKQLAAGGEVTDEEQILTAAQRLKQALPSMIAEHREIEAALGNLKPQRRRKGILLMCSSRRSLLYMPAPKRRCSIPQRS